MKRLYLKAAGLIQPGTYNDLDRGLSSRMLSALAATADDLRQKAEYAPEVGDTILISQFEEFSADVIKLLRYNLRRAYQLDDCTAP
jgi:hypothetical protein